MLYEQLKKELKKELESIFNEKRDSVILDIGCSQNPIYIFDKSNLVVSIDICLEDLKKASLRYKNNSFVCGDINHLPIKENFVDIIYAGFCPAMDIKKVDYSLKRGGFIVINPYHSSLLPAGYNLFKGFVWGRKLQFKTIILKKI